MWASNKSKWQVIGDNTLCTIYSSGVNRGYSYPYRMVRWEEVTPTHRELALELIVDSGFNNDSTTHEEVLEEAKRVNADYLIPKDYPGKPDESVEMMKQFMDIYDAESDSPKPYMVIQPPLADTFERYSDFYSQFGRLAVGGLKNASPETQTDELYEFWNALQACPEVDETTVEIHGFGLGLSPEVVLFLRTYPHVLDSVDVSTPEQSIKYNQVPDAL